MKKASELRALRWEIVALNETILTLIETIKDIHITIDREIRSKILGGKE